MNVLQGFVFGDSEFLLIWDSLKLVSATSAEDTGVGGFTAVGSDILTAQFYQ